ncbi:MAG: VWA domain-containing protein [Magnetococcales bacterium]|nr:VWA domain-containing protein [Magnetococcales bacterium]
MMMDLSTFHFLRPVWFLAVPVVAGALWLWWRIHFQVGGWQKVCDAALLPHVLMNDGGPQSRTPLWLAGVTALIAINALAGPVWQRLPQPVVQQSSALIIVLDMSYSMTAADLKPSRAARAKLKLREILQRRQEGRTGLIAYTAEPFVVAPLTEDAATVESLIMGLPRPEEMPALGSRPDLALLKGIEMLDQAGAVGGRLLLVTDGVDGDDSLSDAAARTLQEQGYGLWILGAGTEGGAPMPMPEGGFVKDGRGEIIVPRMDAQRLGALALMGGGLFHPLTAADTDLDRLLGSMDGRVFDTEQTEQTDVQADIWQEEGFWLVPVILLLMIPWFRRGLLVLLPGLFLIMPQSGQAFEWSNLWQRPDQQGAALMAQGALDQAAQRFDDPEWRAAAYHKAGEYQKALESLDGIDHAEAHYNRGNALARLGKLPEALASYQEALKRQPDHADAQHNLDLVKAQLKQPEGGENQENQSGDKESGEDQQGEGQQGDKSQSGDQSQDQKSSESGESGDSESAEKSDQKSASKQADSAKSAEQDAEDASLANAEKSPEQKASEEGMKRLQHAQSEAEQQADDSETVQQMAKPDDSMTAQEQEQAQATEQWLRRIPDDPGGLLRRKFLYQYQNRNRQSDNRGKPW